MLGYQVVPEQFVAEVDREILVLRSLTVLLLLLSAAIIVTIMIRRR
jgi:hypothetical protein